MLRRLLPLIILFLVITIAVFLFDAYFMSMGFDTSFLYLANLLLFILSLTAFLIQVRGIKSANTNAFIRGIYGSLILKIFVVLIVVFAYVFITKGKINKPSLFTSMALYLVYTFAEVKLLLKKTRNSRNA